MEFRFISGHIALDLMATKRERNSEASDDIFSAPAHFAEWCHGAGILTEGVQVSDGELHSVILLREVGYRLALASVRRENFAATDIALVNHFAAAEPIRVELSARGEFAATGTVANILSTIARDLIALLGQSVTTSIRQCDGDNCTRLFVDRSRGQNRRFCSDQVCGNRAKVAAFRRRTRTNPDVAVEDK